MKNLSRMGYETDLMTLRVNLKQRIMKTLRKSLFLLPILLWSVCPGQDFKKVQNLKVPKGKALVYVYSMDKKSYPVVCDGKTMGGLSAKRFVYLVLDSGNHTFNCSAKTPALNVLVEPERVYYIVQKQKETLMLEADAGKAERELATYKVSGNIITSFVEAPEGSDAYRQGFLDAETYFIKTQGANIGNAIATGLTSPVIGLIPALITSGSKPADKNLHVPDPTKLADEEYMKGYREGAFKAKKRAVWSGYATGASIWALFIILV